MHPHTLRVRSVGTPKIFDHKIYAGLEEIVEVETSEVWVEHHVDFLHIDDRLSRYPFWGGGISVRRDKKKTYVLELGQDETAYHHNDEKKCMWWEHLIQ